MIRFNKILSSTVLAIGLLIAGIGSGCAEHVRVYDEYHSDWHHWDHDEDDAYRRYMNDRHESYRDYNSLSKDEQRDYWNWRHQNQDRDKH